MDKALLFISGSQTGNADKDGFEVLSYHFSTDREIDKRGLVVTSLKGLLIELEIYSLKGKALAIGMMFDIYQTVKGSIEFYTNDDAGGDVKYKTVKFESGHIISYVEDYHVSSNKSMTEKFTISAGKVDVEGGSYSHEWKGKV